MIPWGRRPPLPASLTRPRGQGPGMDEELKLIYTFDFGKPLDEMSEDIVGRGAVELDVEVHIGVNVVIAQRDL
jgi:hypothetical protein